MFITILFLVVAILCLAGWVALAANTSQRYNKPEGVTMTGELKQRWWLGVAGVVALIIGLSVVQVNAGEVGVIRRFGAVQAGELQPGLHVISPIADNVLTYNTKQMVYEASDKPDSSQANYTDYSVNTMTNDGQRIKVRFTVVFSIDPTMAGQVANTVGTESDVVEKIIKSNARSEARNVPKKFSAEDLYSENVYKAQAALFAALEPVYAKNGVILQEFLLRDIAFAADLAEALERKQIALEDAITSERQVKVKEAEAAQKIAAARGTKEASIIEAEGQARSIKLVQDELARSPRYSEYLLAKGLAEGKTGAQTIYLPSDMLPLINMPAAK